MAQRSGLRRLAVAALLCVATASCRSHDVTGTNEDRSWTITTELSSSFDISSSVVGEIAIEKSSGSVLGAVYLRGALSIGDRSLKLEATSAQDTASALFSISVDGSPAWLRGGWYPAESVGTVISGANESYLVHSEALTASEGAFIVRSVGATGADRWRVRFPVTGDPHAASFAHLAATDDGGAIVTLRAPAGTDIGTGPLAQAVSQCDSVLARVNADGGVIAAWRLPAASAGSTRTVGRVAFIPPDHAAVEVDDVPSGASPPKNSASLAFVSLRDGSVEWTVNVSGAEDLASVQAITPRSTGQIIATVVGGASKSTFALRAVSSAGVADNELPLFTLPGRHYAVASDPTGGVVIAGAFDSSFSVGSTVLSPVGGTDAVALRFGFDGGLRGYVQVGTNLRDEISAVAVDDLGNLVMAGTQIDAASLPGDMSIVPGVVFVSRVRVDEQARP